MNTFLKILGLLVLTIIAIKLAPLFLLPLFLLAIGALAAGIVIAGGATLAILVLLAVIGALAPIWLPVALLVGLIALICRLARGHA